jgi:hypothetical protein
MKFYNYLKENFAFGIKYGDYYYEVFVNPTFKEMIEVSKDDSANALRFIAFTNKKLYVHTANLIHNDVFITGKYKNDNPYLPGVAIRKGNNFVYHDSDSFNGFEYKGKWRSIIKSRRLDKFEKAMLTKDWSWTEKYIKGLNNHILKIKNAAKKAGAYEIL